MPPAASGLRCETINSASATTVTELERQLARRRGRPAADLTRAARQPRVRQQDHADRRRPARPDRDRRGALHLRLGPRLPARLPPHRPHRRPPRRLVGADPRLHRHRQRPRRRRRRRPARRRTHHVPRAAAPRGARAQHDRASTGRPNASPGSPTRFPSSTVRASSTASPCATSRTSPPGSPRRASTSRPYFGSLDNEARIEAERKLQTNEIKALVATTALGMGYDKPDLSFVVHFQSPGSPVAYYQQVGRAGRALDDEPRHPAARPGGRTDPGLVHRAGLRRGAPRQRHRQRVRLVRRAGAADGDPGEAEREDRHAGTRRQATRRRRRARTRRRHQLPAHARAVDVPGQPRRGGHDGAPARTAGDGRLLPHHRLPDALHRQPARRPRAPTTAESATTAPAPPTFVSRRSSWSPLPSGSCSPARSRSTPKKMYLDADTGGRKKIPAERTARRRPGTVRCGATPAGASSSATASSPPERSTTDSSTRSPN